MAESVLCEDLRRNLQPPTVIRQPGEVTCMHHRPLGERFSEKRLNRGFPYENGKERPAWNNAYHSAQELSRSLSRKDFSEVRGENGAQINGQTIEQPQRIGPVARVDLRMNGIGECIVDNRPETHGLFPTGTAG